MKPTAVTSILFSAIAALTLGTQAVAGTEVGNAGVRELKDDTVVLADPWMQRPADGKGHPFSDFPRELRIEIGRIGFLLVRLGADPYVETDRIPMRPPTDAERDDMIRTAYLNRSANAKFVVDAMMGQGVEYHFVDSLDNGICPPRDAENGEYRTSDGEKANIKTVACTANSATFIVRGIFARMSYREQAKTLLHERLHSVLDGNPHYFIADVTDGVEALLTLFNQQVGGERPVLAGEQDPRFVAISRLIYRIGQLGLRSEIGKSLRPWQDGKVYSLYNDWQVSLQGGGLVHREADVSPKAYVGVGSLVGRRSKLAAGSQFILSACFLGGCELKAAASMFDSLVGTFASARDNHAIDFIQPAYTTRLAEGASVSYSMLMSAVSVNDPNAVAWDLAEDSSVASSSISGFSSVGMFAGSSLVESNLNAIAGQGSLSLLFGVGAEIRGLAGAALLLDGGGKTPRSEVIVADRAKLDFGGKFACPSTSQGPGFPLLVRDSFRIENANDLTNRCLKPNGP